MSGRTFLPMIAAMLAIMGGLYIIGATAPPSNASPPAQAGIILSTDDCREVDAGESAKISISIHNTPALFAFEIYFAYDPELLEVVNREVVADIDRGVPLFLSQGANSNVFDFSDPVPNSTGLYRLAAADVALGGTAETGDGTLATIELRARRGREGISPAAIFRSDNVALGPRLTTVGGGKIGDTDGDEIFDGIIASGQVAIGTPCDPVAPTVNPEVIGTLVPTQSPSDSEDDPTGSSDGGPDPSTTDGPDSTDGPGGAPAESLDAGATSTPTPDPDDTDNTDSSGGPVRIDGAGGDGFASGGDDTFWGIVLIGGGVTLGLAVTYAFARMTRRPA